MCSVEVRIKLQHPSPPLRQLVPSSLTRLLCPLPLPALLLLLLLLLHLHCITCSRRALVSLDLTQCTRPLRDLHPLLVTPHLACPIWLLRARV